MDVQVGRGSETLARLVTALDEAGPGGENPVAAALGVALEYFTKGQGAILDGSKLVVLITDGGANCNPEHSDCDSEHCTFNIEQEASCFAAGDNCCTDATFGTIGCLDDVRTVSTAITLQQNGIRIAVVGLPGSERYSTLLSLIAVQGGMNTAENPPSYYQPDSADALTSMLADLMRTVSESCRMRLDSEAPEGSNIALAADCIVVERKDVVTGAPQWVYDPGSPPFVYVFGSNCQKLNDASRVDIAYGCPRGS